MSSRLEVLVIILALLQRKTLIEAKSRTLKCLKWHYSTVRSMKNVAVLKEDGAFALFFRPHPGGFDSSRVPTPGNLPSKAKKLLMPGGQSGGVLGAGWNWLVHKILKISYVRCRFVKFDIYFLGLPLEIFFDVITDNWLHL